MSRAWWNEGKKAYLTYVRTLGEYDATPWDALVWREQLAWCEVAKAMA